MFKENKTANGTETQFNILERHKPCKYTDHKWQKNW